MGNRRELSRQCNNMHLKMALVQVPLYTLQWNAYTPRTLTKKKKLFIHWQSEKNSLHGYYIIAKPHLRRKEKRILFLTDVVKFDTNEIGLLYVHYRWC